MAVESATFLTDLNPANPAGSDGTDRGDDHIRLLKSVLLSTFPNLSGEVTVTADQLNSIADLATTLSSFLLRDGTRPMTGSLEMGGHRVTGVGTPTADTDVATKQYVDEAVAAAREAATEALSAAYPVGVRVILGSSSDPAVFLGFGEWALVAQNRVMVGAGDEFVRGSTGGSSSIRLTTAQLPEHDHTLIADQEVDVTPLQSDNQVARGRASGSTNFNYGLRGSSFEANLGKSGTTGQGEAVDFMPRYEAVNIWQRTS